LRILDADILAYALYNQSPAHTSAWDLVENCITQGIPLNVTPTTILETYNTLFWHYRVRPAQKLLEKLSLTVDEIQVVDTSINGLVIAQTDNIPLGDALLIATALQNNIPIIVTNDKHIINLAPKYGLITENPISEETRKKLSEWSPMS
jgi:predicted nucleic acid-binding protein